MDPADPVGASEPLAGLMRRLREDLAEVDESIALVRRHRWQPCASDHQMQAVDGERFLYAAMREVLLVLARTPVEPNRRLTFAFVPDAGGDARPGPVSVTEIDVRVEWEHLHGMTREEEPRVFLHTRAVREVHCPAELRARLADLSDPPPAGEGRLVLVLVDERGPTIAEVW